MILKYTPNPASRKLNNEWPVNIDLNGPNGRWSPRATKRKLLTERDRDESKILEDICDQKYVIPLSVLGPSGEVKFEKIKAKRQSEIFLTKDDSIAASSNKPRKSKESRAPRIQCHILRVTQEENCVITELKHRDRLVNARDGTHLKPSFRLAFVNKNIEHFNHQTKK